MAGVVFDVVKAIPGVLSFIMSSIDFIERRFSNMEMTSDRKSHIIDKLEKIRDVTEEIDKLFEGSGRKSQVLASGLRKLHEQMDMCKKHCQPFSNQSLTQVKNIEDFCFYAKNLFFAETQASRVNELEKGLDDAIRMTEVTLVAFYTKSSITSHQEIMESCSASAGGRSGFYSVKTLGDKPPGRVKNLKANAIDTFGSLVLSWQYEGRKLFAGVTYEVSISRIVSQKIIHICNRESKYCYAIICDPLLKCGKRYVFKVRAVKSFPGEWSDEVITYFRTDVPSKPEMPQVKVTGTHSIQVSVVPPSEDDSNGDPVTHCIVEILPRDANSTCWIQHSFPLKQITFNLNDLRKYCHYDVRIIFKNNTGCSEPSDLVHVLTEEPVPSVPTNFRFSRYRTAHIIEVQWDKPHSNSRFVNHYRIDYRTRFAGKWHTASTTSKLSVCVTELSSDRRYYFRVQAVNTTGEASEFTSTIDQVTRFSRGARLVLTPLVFLGGTLASPFILGGAVGKTMYDDMNKDQEDKDISDVASGVAKGVLSGFGTGAFAAVTIPVTGPVTGAVLASLFLNPDDEFRPATDDNVTRIP